MNTKDVDKEHIKREEELKIELRNNQTEFDEE